MELPRPVLPSQRYSPNTSTADYYDRRQQVSGPRQPLRESSGNAQPQHLGALTLCSQNLSALTSLPHSIPTPPIVPTQSLDSHYGPGSNLKLRRHQLHLQRRQRHGINPIYLSPQFQAYRKKQAEKDYKTAQIWPDFLEDAFLDALLLIPQMGRRKYTMRGQQHGRNMLISEYLWVAYCISLPPGEKPSKLMRRERKQVSSHIQVLKNFFIHHRCYHFFFPGKEKKDDRRDSIETESFKDNPVLRALSEGRLPDERPNYEYFAQLLASDALVTVRPSLCWILVSNNSVEVEMDGPLRGTGFAPSGEKLNPKLYPHLGLNLKREEWPERGKIIRGTLLQEYARTLSQKEASSVKELSQDWEENFPDLYTPLEEVVQNNLRDILHFHVTLDVQEPDQFPEGSELNSLVEITIEQPALQNHTWKAVTRLARPWQLTRDEKTDPPVVEVTREMGVQYVHRQGCENHARCDCSVTARLRRQQLAVPFPAPEWATMLSHLATFAKHPQVNKSKVKVEYDEKGNRTHASKEPTQMDLVKKIAMFQELWSCPPGSGQWTRRAVILWTFETMHGLDDKGKIINNSVGTTWRFLTAIDPTSQYHQQHALVSGSSQPPVNRDAIMSPGPGYQQHLTAAMNENFGSAWDQQSPLGMPSGHHGSVPYGPGAISILDSLPHGLATPPPSASFHSTYANGLSAAHQHDMNGHLSFMSNPAMDTKSTMMSAPDSLYATAGGVSVYDESPVDCDPSSSFQGWDANSMPAMDTRLQPSWTTNFDFSSQGPPQHGNPSHMWNHGLAPSDAKPNVSSSHWAATVASADDKGDAAAWNGQPQSWMQTVAAGDGSGAAPPTWDDSMPPPSSDATAPQGVPTAGTGAGAPQFHRSHSNQGVRNQLSRSATTGSLAGPRAGQKRGRSDSLDERDEYPLASMPKLSHHVSVANAKYAAAVSAAGAPAPPQGVVDGGADQAGSGGEPW